MPTAQVTFTGNLGAGVAVTSKVFTQIVSFSYDLRLNVLELIDINGIVTQVDMAGRTTLTDTISGGNHTIAIS